MAWLILVVAGLCEIGWAIGLKYTEGWTRPGPSVVTLTLLAASMYCLAEAARSLPIGTAYAVWTGIGAVGTVIVGVVAFDDPLGPVRAALLFVLVAAMVGLKLSGDSKRAVQPSSGRGR